MNLEPHRVNSRTPVTLAGGRPAAPGEIVDIDPAANQPLIAAGALAACPPTPQHEPKHRPKTKETS